MEWTPARVIGHNVREVRERRGMSAAALGQEVGQHFGKPWPRQTVHLIERGERAMVAAEVAALAEILNVTVIDLFSPPPGVGHVMAGTLPVAGHRLAAPPAADADVEMLATTFEGVEEVSRRLFGDLRLLARITDDARAALRGEEIDQPPQGQGFGDALARVDMEDVDRIYENVRARRGGRGPVNFDAVLTLSEETPRTDADGEED